MLKIPLHNFRKSIFLSLTNGRRVNSGSFKSSVRPVAAYTYQLNTVRELQGGRAAAHPQSAGYISGLPVVVPSTHRIWLLKKHLAGRCVRHFSVTSTRFCDVDDQIQIHEKGIVRSRGLRRAVRRGRIQNSSLEVSKEKPYEYEDNVAISNPLIDPINETEIIEASIHETDECINIHDPQGKESVNEFDAQYFNDGLLLSGTRNSNVTESYDDKTGVPEERNSGNPHEHLNEIDQQYFGSLTTFSNPKRRKSQLKTNASVEQRTLSLGNDMNEIDKQYFIKSNQVSNVHDLKHENMFSDTGVEEDAILDGLRRKEKLQTQIKLLTKNDRIEKYEPHEKPTRVTFETLNDFEQEAAMFANQEENIPADLQRELKAERRSLEKAQKVKDDFDINFELIEPEVKETLTTVERKPKQSAVQKLSDKADPSLEASKIPCSGCGAYLHCHDADKPGFMTSKQYLKFMENVRLENYSKTMKTVCIRCSNLMKRREALNVSVNQEDYMNIIKTIRRKRALVLVMVDLLDFPCSFIPNLQDIIGNKHVCLVGNKLDLLPIDSKNYEQRIKDHLLRACVKAGVCAEENVRDISLISAKTGYGIELLISKLHKNWGTQGDVYILGTANVGKSTLFNCLLESDYCKSKASYLQGKATISPWPGTTLHLLRFPIIKMDKIRTVMRNERLKLDRIEEKESKMKDYFSQITLDKKAEEMLDRFAYVKGDVGRTFDKYKVDEKEIGFSINKDPFNTTLTSSTDTTETKTAKVTKEALPFDFDPKEFEDGKWFYDTPGVISDQQVLTKLTLEELKAVVPKSILQPKSLVLKPGQSFFLAGLGRLDYVKGDVSIYFTTFACKRLPIRVVNTDEADEFYTQHAGNKYMEVPMGGAERIKTFPALKPVDMEVTGIGWEESAADILFSSAGWASVTAGFDMNILLRAYTPGGSGCYLRQPALLPFAVNMRGKRIKGTPFYSIFKRKLVKYM